MGWNIVWIKLWWRHCTTCVFFYHIHIPPLSICVPMLRDLNSPSRGFQPKGPCSKGKSDFRINVHYFSQSIDDLPIMVGNLWSSGRSRYTVYLLWLLNKDQTSALIDIFILRCRVLQNSWDYRVLWYLIFYILYYIICIWYSVFHV